jgi:Rrf2 family protein
MKLTNACRYAVHAVAFMAVQKSHKHVPSYEIARAQGVPERFLLKVLRSLVDAQVVESVKGPHGGYRLAKPAKKITLLELIQAVDGPVQGQVSFTEVHGADSVEKKLIAICDRTAAGVRRQLEKLRFADLMRRG